MNKLSSFLKLIVKKGSAFYQSIKKGLDEFNNEISKPTLYTSMMEFYNDFYKVMDLFLGNLNQSLNTLETEIVNKINTFVNEHTKINESNFNAFSKFMTDLQSEKKLIEKAKKKYFECSKEVNDYEQKFVKNEINLKLKEENKQKEVEHFIKLKQLHSNELLNYQNQITKMNNLIKEQEINYINIKNQITTDYEKLLSKTQSFFTYLVKLLNDNSKHSKECSEKILTLIQKVNIRRDIQTFNIRFDYSSEDKTRFVKEEFLDYNLIHQTIDKSSPVNPIQMLPSNTTPPPIINKEDLFNIEGMPPLDNDKLKYICCIDVNHNEPENEDNENILESFIEKDNKFTPIIEKIITNNDSISNDELTIVTYELEKKKPTAEKFLFCLLKYYINQENSVQVQSLVNLHHLANMLLIIVENTIKRNRIFYLNYLIMYISEKTFYINPDNMFNKCYLCQLLSMNKVYNNKMFWIRLMKIKICLLLDKEIKEEIERKELLNRGSKNMVFKVANLFSNIRVEKNRKIENEILYKQLFLEKQPSVAVKVIEDYIFHFANFHQEINNSIDIIITCSLEYKFDREYVNYFNAELRSNLHTVKTKKAIMEGVELTVDFKSLYFEENFCNILKDKTQMEKLLACGLRYLPINDFASVLTVNKGMHNSIVKLVYRNILFKYHNMPIETRFKIWKNLINYHEISQKHNYKDILSKVKEIKINPNYPNIIDLDVLRTPFDSNEEENKIKISNILKSIQYTLPNVQYSQGMNYIAAFILNMTNSEEEAFYFYLSLLISTEYGDLFINDLAKLKKYFYVFDRLLSVLMPETYFYFKQNKINVGCFISPWFITLFTITFQYIEHVNPKVLIRIWDLFLFEGFNSIIKIGISCIKHYEDKILKLRFEELLQFLMNDIVKSDYFSNNNFEKLMFITVNFKIEEELFKSIENEITIRNMIKEKLPNFELKDK